MALIERGKITFTLLLAIISISYLAFRLFFIFPVFSDENIYINMAKAVKEGLVPYKDFFYAHPPVQLFLFQPVLILFGANFAAVKIFILILGIATVGLTYVIARKIFGDFSALLSSLFFLSFPGFFIFSNQAMGMFEALLFFLLGFYCLINKKIALSSVFLAGSIFTRYMMLILLPFLLYYMYKFDRKAFGRFTKLLLLTTALITIALVAFFGNNFLVQTITFQAHANLSVDAKLAEWIGQYLTLGFFTIFLSLTALIFAIMRKDHKILIFALYPLLCDLFILLSVKFAGYHYFLLSLPLLFISIGATFANAKYSIARALIVIVFALSITTNLSSLGIYANEMDNKVFPALAAYVKENLGENETIFGEPRAINYVSFVTGARIASNYFSSDLKVISFEGKEMVFSEINRSRPKIIVMDNANNYIQNFGGYRYVKEWAVPAYYNMSLYKSG